MLWRIKNRLHRALLDQHPGLHDGDMVGKLPNQIQIMGNEKHSHGIPGLKLAKQIQNLLTHRHVQGRRWLIGQ